MNSDKLYVKFIHWRARHINERQLILILSFAMGILGGLAAILLKNTVATIHHLLNGLLNIDRVNYFYLAFPVIGIFLKPNFQSFLVFGFFELACQ